MSDRTLTAETLTLEDTEETQLGLAAESNAVAVKAAPGNTEGKVIKVAGSKEQLEAGDFYPLEPGEKLAFDLSGSGVWVQAEVEGDKLHILTLAP